MKKGIDYLAARVAQAIHEYFEESAAMDHLIDCGEWSVPANAKALDLAMEKAGKGFGMTAEEMEANHFAWACHETESEMLLRGGA